jgi:hypothetical protein
MNKSNIEDEQWHALGSPFLPMPSVFVNDVAQELPNSAETWGDLLNTLDADAAQRGVILSATRFDGVEEPAFRAATLTARPLAGFGRIDVQTAVPAAFVRECLLDAITPLQETAQRTKQLAGIFRGHDLTPAHQGLRDLAAELGAAMVLADVLAGPVGIDLTAVSDEGITAAQHLKQLEKTIDALVEAQEHSDWLTVADILEYDLEPAIRRWAALLTMITCQLQVQS